MVRQSAPVAEAARFDDFKKLDKDTRQASMKDNHATYGPELDAKIKEATEEKRQERMQSCFKGTGPMKDKEFLVDKYKDRPVVLKNILDNSYTFVCPITKQRLWTDPIYEVGFGKSEEATRTTTRRVEVDQVGKRQDIGKHWSFRLAIRISHWLENPRRRQTKSSIS